MKKLIYTLIAFTIIASTSNAQTTAMDFTKNDCHGTPHNLFTELDAGNVIILEFVMNCSSCIAAGHAIETMMTDLDMQYPGTVRLYQIAYDNSMTCTTMNQFATANNFSSTTFDQGAALVAYYGGFGMPTIAIVAGAAHNVIYGNVGFAPADTGHAGTAIRSFLNTLSTQELPSSVASFTSFPNPANDIITVRLNLKNTSTVNLQIVDITGKLVMEISTEDRNSGIFEKQIEVSSLTNGNYFLKAVVDGKPAYSKINIAR